MDAHRLTTPRRFTTPCFPLAALLLFAAQALGEGGGGEGAPCLAWNDDPSFASGVKTVEVTRGIRLEIPPGGPRVVVGANLFTGEVLADSRLALCAHEPAGDRPGALLAEGFFTVKNPIGWQGTLFDRPVVLAPSSTYWLVWDAPAGAQMPWGPPQTTLGHAHRVSLDGGQTWEPQLFQSPASHFKIELLGPCACPGALLPLGDSCGKSGLGLVPLSCAQAGSTLTLRVGGAAPDAWILFVAGTEPALWPLGAGCTLFVSPKGAVAWPVPTDAGGTAGVALPLPPSIKGQPIVAQAFSFWGGIGASPAVAVAVP